MTYVFDIPAFRISYPAFADTTKFPDITLTTFYNTATCYISDTDYGYLSGTCRYTALTLMTAHLTALSVLITSNKVPGLVQSAAIDKISTSLTSPPVKTQWGWWLSLTGYGQQLLALLQASAVGGFYLGGSLERSAFIKSGWLF